MINLDSVLKKRAIILPTKVRVVKAMVALVVKNLIANAADMRHGFHPFVRKTPWRRAQEPISVFFPGKSHGQGKLVGHSS